MTCDAVNAFRQALKANEIEQALSLKHYPDSLIEVIHVARG